MLKTMQKIMEPHHQRVGKKLSTQTTLPSKAIFQKMKLNKVFLFL